MVDQLIDATIIRRTQGTLGKFVKKPNLSDKLLSKPPFRFLFDVINVVSSNILGNYCSISTFCNELIFRS